MVQQRHPWLRFVARGKGHRERKTDIEGEGSISVSGGRRCHRVPESHVVALALAKCNGRRGGEMRRRASRRFARGVTEGERVG
jgi:hypothetical protein